MKNNKDIVYLIENGLHVKTLSKMSVPQIRVLVEKFKNSKEETKEIETVTSTKIIATPEEAKKGIPIQGKTMAKELPDGRLEFSETEFTESVEVDSDPNKETETVISFGRNLLAEPSIIYALKISSVMVSELLPYFSTILFIASFR